MTLELTAADVEAAASDADPAQTATPGRTSIPERGAVEPQPRRRVRGIGFDEAYNLLGATAVGIAVASLLFGWLTPMTGVIGWAVIAYLAFVGCYALLVSLRSDRRAVADRVVTVLLYSAGLILLGTLIFVIAFTVFRGLPAVLHLNFFTQPMTLAGPLDPLSVGGVLHAIVGTLIQISIALAITIPLGIATAVFLNEVGGRFARFVRTISDAMTALPSIVAGLFVYAAIVTLVTHQKSGFAAALAISIMMLPIIIRAADVVLRLVPANLREASYALGTSKWRTVWHVVLPTARSGLVTAVILGTARGIGETSPVLLTSGITAEMNFDPFNGPMISLPLQVFTLVRSPEPNYIARGFGAGATLVALVLVLFIVARLIGGRGPGQLSPGQRRRTAARSQQDLRRMAEAGAGRLAATQVVLDSAPPAEFAPATSDASTRHPYAPEPAPTDVRSAPGEKESPQ